MTIKIGNYIYSNTTEEIIGGCLNFPRKSSRILEIRVRESMISDRLKINYFRILIEEHTNESFRLIINGKLVGEYSKKEFNEGREMFVDRVIMDYTFKPL